MASTRISRDQIRGLLVPDSRIGIDGLAAIGATTVDSSYTQAGARAGVPVAQQTTAMVLEASGDQTDKGQIEIRTARGGNPGPGNAAFVWRDVAAGDSATQYSGWEGYQLANPYEVIFAGSGASGGSLPSIIRMQDGQALLAYQKENAASGAVQLARYSPVTGAWTAPVTVSAKSLASAQPCPCLVELRPEGRVLLYLKAYSGRNLSMYYSDNSGTSWTLGEAQVLRDDLPVGCTINEVRAAYSGGAVVLFIQYLSGTQEIAQYASTDRGCRFDTVSSSWGVSGESPTAIDVEALAGGGFVLLYCRGHLTNRYHTRTIGSAYEDAQTVTGVEIAAKAPGGLPSCAIWEDEDATLYCVLSISDGGTSYVTSIFRSLTRGESWEPWGGPVAEIHRGATDTELNEFACTSTGGLALLVTRYTVPVEADTSSAVLCVYLGGYSNTTAPATDEEVGGVVIDNYEDTAYVPWSQSDDNGKPGGLYLGIEKPANVGWVSAGAGAESITSDLILQIDSGGVHGHTMSFNDLTVTTCVGEVVAKTDGGSVATDQCYMLLSISDGTGGGAAGTFTYIVRVHVSSTGWAIYDVNAAAQVGATQTINMGSADPEVRVRVAIDSGGNLKSWYSLATPQRTEWIAGPTSSTLTNTAAAADNVVGFGSLTVNASNSYFRHVGFCMWGKQWGPNSQASETLADVWVNPTDLHPRAYSTSPALLHDGVRLYATRGPTYQGEKWDIEPAHEYALTNIFPTVAPSPRRAWRSVADNSQMYITFKLDADFASSRMLNHALGMVLLNTNLATVDLETYSGAVWTKIGGWDSTTDWTGLKYDRRGDTIYPQPGVAGTAKRYLWHTAHAGDTFDLAIGGADDLHTIKSNTEGAWVPDDNTKHPTLQLDRDNLPGALAATNTGTGIIRRKNAGLIVSSYSSNDYLMRLNIPAQKTAEGYYRIGTLMLGHLVVFGHEYDRGWTQTREHDAEVFRRQGGSRRARTRGPSRRAVEISWADTAVDASLVQANSPIPPWIGAQSTTSLSVTTPYDLVQLLEGVTESLGGPVTPVVYLSRVVVDTAASHALTDPREFVYGRLTANTRVENVLGREGVDELNRAGTITISEEV